MQEPAPKRRKVKPKKGGKARRRRALRNMPSDAWAAVFSQLPSMERELPGLRLVCRQVQLDIYYPRQYLLKFVLNSHV